MGAVSESGGCGATERAALPVDWSLLVVPEGSFVVLVSESPDAWEDAKSLKREMPAAFRDRVLIFTGFKASRD